MKSALLSCAFLLTSGALIASPSVDVNRPAQLRDALANGLDPVERHATKNDLLDAAQAFDYVEELAASLAQEGRACYPAGSTREKRATVVLDYLSTNTNQWPYPASHLVTDALVKAYPCAKKQ